MTWHYCYACAETNENDPVWWEPDGKGDKNIVPRQPPIEQWKFCNEHKHLEKQSVTPSLAERFKGEIDLFFWGLLIPHHIPKRGHVWIAEHGVVDTLTVEPPEGGQYEIAIRFKDPRNYYPLPKPDMYSGYIADDGFLRGRNTGGH